MNVLCRVTVGNQEGIRSRKTSFKCCCRNERSVSELQNCSKLINSNHASVHIHVLVIQFPCLFQLIFILGHDIPYASVFQLSFMNPIRCLCLCLSKFKGKIYAVWLELSRCLKLIQDSFADVLYEDWGKIIFAHLGCCLAF